MYPSKRAPAVINLGAVVFHELKSGVANMRRVRLVVVVRQSGYESILLRE
jgi:hypothetical protein